MNKRIFVEKKVSFEIEKKSLIETLKKEFFIDLPNLRYILSYDLFNIEVDLYQKSKYTVFGDTVTDEVFEAIDLVDDYLAYEYLPGQFDQRADSAEQCLSIIDPAHQVTVKSGFLILFGKKIDKNTYQKIKNYLINPVESRIKDLDQMILPQSSKPSKVEQLNGFITMNEDDLHHLLDEMQLAMSMADLKFIQAYYRDDEKRNPYETEIRVLDTYWSDHCRHTTFETIIEQVTFGQNPIDTEIEKTYHEYLSMRKTVDRHHKPVTLMDMATINAFYELKRDNLNDLEISDENNAATLEVSIDVDGKLEPWLLLVKNETHNHPTEIEPFGGASTCIGGAIRDPLSGRVYVYQALRISGAGNILAPIDETLEGKLPQVVISKEAARGFSSYGNQIGLATSHVKEFYHDGYVAKRFEMGIVVGAAPKENIKKEKPMAGDVVILLGGKTGRDGIGGATGSSKVHHVTSLTDAASEVQKGNAPEERKIQRLFRDKKATRLIRKANDFGAGGVCVAVGELAAGIDIQLDLVPLKYEGLNPTEIAISESQERMAVVVAKEDVKQFINYASNENIEATVIAQVTDEDKLRMYYKGQKLVDIKRSFLSTNGVRVYAEARVSIKDSLLKPKMILNKDSILNHLSNLNVSIQKGLSEMFDSTVGSTTVFMPYGGKNQLTETQVSVHRFPVLNHETHDVSAVTYGFDPHLTESNPYLGGIAAVVESLAKLVSIGADYKDARFTCQEFFYKLNDDKDKWGSVVSTLLGSIKAMKAFNLASIGGKDSMSGTFGALEVPPTFVAISFLKTDERKLISPEFKHKDSYIYLFRPKRDAFGIPDFDQLKQKYDDILKLISKKEIVAAFALTKGGLIEALCKMAYGNEIGFDIHTDLDVFDIDYGAIVIESKTMLSSDLAIYLGRTIEKDFIINGIHIKHEEALSYSIDNFSKVYPIKAKTYREMSMSEIKQQPKMPELKHKSTIKVLLPVFPGTNCDYDTYQAFMKAGAKAEFLVFNNLNKDKLIASLEALSSAIDRTNILVLSGGFSAGDEPAGSGKFMANVLRNQKVKAAIDRLLKRDGLILGICNGFQALIKSGLLPNVKLGLVDSSNPTLFKNDINRHISTIKHVKVSSTNSPWLSWYKLNEVQPIVLSHGEGKLIVEGDEAKKLFENNQIAFQYVDQHHQPTMNPAFNPNGSYYAIEGIISSDGKILGRMGHPERLVTGLYKNVPNIAENNMFKQVVSYLKGV